MQNKNLTKDNDNLQERIVRAAQKLFSEKGLREVTMDDVSHYLRISKRTLYQTVRDKEELILLCYHSDAEEQEARIKQELENSDNVLNIIFKQIEYRIQQINTISLSSLAEISRYPRLIEAVRQRRRDSEEIILRFIETGVKQGLLEPDIDFRLLLRTLNALSNVTDDIDYLKGYTPENIYVHPIFILLRGCATEKGRQQLDDYRKTHRPNTP